MLNLASRKLVAFLIPTILFFILNLLAGCGVPGPGNTGQGGGSGSIGDSSDFEPEMTIGVIVEATSGMQEELAYQFGKDWDKSLFAALTPSKAIALEGLNQLDNLPINAIEVVALDHDLKEISSPNIPQYNVEKRLSTGYEIRFASPYVAQINIAIKVTFNTDNFIYAPLYNTSNDNESIVVNIGSHYLMTRLMGEINSAEELANSLPCDNFNNNCSDQFKRKAELLALTAKSIDAYDIEFESDLSVEQALSFLNGTAEFRNHTLNAIAEITREVDPIAKGTNRAFNILDGDVLSKLNVSSTYNSSLFSFAVNDYEPDDLQEEVILATSLSTIFNSNSSTFPTYPTLQRTSSTFEIRREVVSIDIPFTREGVLIGDNHGYSPLLSEPVNAFSTLQSDTFSSTEGAILNDRIVLQTIPGEDDEPKDIGWNINPMYSKLYLSNEVEPSIDLTSPDPNAEPIDYGDAPTWLTTANYNGGTVYQLNSDTGNFQRESKREQLNRFSWEVHGLRTNDDFEKDDIQGQEFGVLNYSIALDDSNPLINIYADTLHWDAGATMTESQPSAFFDSYTLTRNNTSVTRDGPTSVASSTSRLYFTRQTSEATQEHPNGIDRNLGLIELDGGLHPASGHSSQNGKHLAFVQDNSDRGRGMIVATAERNSTPIFSQEGERYLLQGNSIEMSDDDNVIRNLNNSVLHISADPGNTQDCIANLELHYQQLNHSNISNLISNDSRATIASLSSDSCTLGTTHRGAIEIHFDRIFSNDPDAGDALTLKGFISETGNVSSTMPGNLINLLWLQENNLGLVFAHRDQELSPTFPEP